MWSRTFIPLSQWTSWRCLNIVFSLLQHRGCFGHPLIRRAGSFLWTVSACGALSDLFICREKICIWCSGPLRSILYHREVINGCLWWEHDAKHESREVLSLSTPTFSSSVPGQGKFWSFQIRSEQHGPVLLLLGKHPMDYLSVDPHHFLSKVIKVYLDQLQDVFYLHHSSPAAEQKPAG